MSQVSPIVVQSWHNAPLEPQDASIVPAWQLSCASQHPSHVSEHGHAPPDPPNCVWQLPLLSQHPLGHVAGPQAKPAQAPFSQKPVAGQVAQVPPPNPQSLGALPGWQLPFVSQHPWQVSSLHCVSTQLPPMHCEVASHSLQNSPPIPHSKTWLPGWQAPFPSQHPVGQLAALHTDPSHVPWKHSAPVLQTAH